jgi:long-chain acyl-CoA synthetase
MSTERPWLNIYPQGVPANIDPDKYQSVVELIEESFKKFRSKAAFTSMGKSLTYEEIDRMSRDFGAYLISRGLEPGDKVALMMPNLLQYPVALYGALRAGLVVVNTNPLYTPREMKHQFTDSGVKAILIAENFAHNLEKILPDTGIKTILVTSIGEMLSPIKRTIVNFVVRHIKKMVPAYHLPNVVTMREALRRGREFQLPQVQRHPDDVILLQYTGGTTGLSKGAMLTNRNLIANMLQIRAIMEPTLEEGKEIILCPLPLYHIFAFTVNCLALFSYGALSVLIVNARDLKSVIKELNSHKVTIMPGVNTLFNALLNHPDISSVDFSSLKITVGGGMAVQRAVAERWQQTTGCYLGEGYGLTETSPVLSVTPLDGSGGYGTIGLPAPSTDMRIVDEEGRICGPDEVGEIQAKGPQIMKGYYEKPEETAKSIKDGWFATGDVGLMQANGFFRIVDRKKDMILVSGFNVYPNEIEDVLAAHPKVLESAAVGMPDEKSGELVKVFVVKKDPSLTEKELIDYCKENLTNYKVPKAVVFRDELPKTNVGKILRRALRDT